MSVQMEHETEGGVSSLITGIMQDITRLVSQQLTLFQVEIKNDIKRSAAAIIRLAIGGAMMLLAMLFLGMGAAFFLNWAFPNHLPVWGGFAIVGGVIALVGGGLLLWGKSMLEHATLLPEKSLEALKENIEWKTKN